MGFMAMEKSEDICSCLFSHRRVYRNEQENMQKAREGPGGQFEIEMVKINFFRNLYVENYIYTYFVHIVRRTESPIIFLQSTGLKRAHGRLIARRGATYVVSSTPM